MKNFYLTDTVYLSGCQYKASQLMDTLSLLQNSVKPIKIKQELLFFQADQYILGVMIPPDYTFSIFWPVCSIASFFFILILQFLVVLPARPRSPGKSCCSPCPRRQRRQLPLVRPHYPCWLEGMFSLGAWLALVRPRHPCWLGRLWLLVFP